VGPGRWSAGSYRPATRAGPCSARCRAGGAERLKLVAYRVQELSPGNTYGTVRSMESFWDGICGWQV
jgi:hypothetical protein